MTASGTQLQKSAGNDTIATNIDLLPPAYFIDDTRTVTLWEEGMQQYSLTYAGLPMYITFSDFMNDIESIINKQYIQVDLTTVKYVGGIITQGGYYDAVLSVVLPLSNGSDDNQSTNSFKFNLTFHSWMTQFIVSLSNDSTGFQTILTDSGIPRVCI